MHYAALLSSIILNAVALVLMKSFALAVGNESANASVLRRLLDARIIVSVLCYGIAAVSWLIALMRVDLMVAYPSLAVTYVVVALLGPRLFGEHADTQRWVGTTLIMVGVVLMHL